MQQRCDAGIRNLVFLVSAALLPAAMASGQMKSWNVMDGNWNTGGNWSPVGVPGPANLVFIGNTANAENSLVTLNVNAAISSLTITDGMRLKTGASQLVVTGATNISGSNSNGQQIWISEISVDNGPNAFDAILGSATLSDDGRIDMNGGTLILNGVLTINQDAFSLGGEGVVRLQSNAPVAMLNDGGIGAGLAGLTIFQDGTGLIDLDGSAAGDILNITLGKIDETDFADLALHGTALADQMDDDIWLTCGGSLTMDFDDGWTFGSGATWTFFGVTSGFPAAVNGTHVDLFGDLEFISLNSYAQFNCPATTHPSMAAPLTPGDLLEFNGTTTVDGGLFTLDDGANVEFNGSTIVHGGEFVTFSDSAGDGLIQFNGPTTWDGDIIIDGIGRQNGDASVSGPTHIVAGRFDMDGTFLSNWSIANSLVIDANEIDSIGNGFDGNLSLTGGFLGKLTINLQLPNTHWQASGIVDVGGVAAIPVTRIEGSEFWLTGIMNVSNRVNITAKTHLRDFSTVNFAGPGAHLRLSGTSLVQDGCTFSGGGLLANLATGKMKLEQGTNLGSTNLLNAGLLELGSSPGLAFVNNFTCEPTAVWRVELGGAVPAFEHDQLMVNGRQSTLGGQLDVRLIDIGGGIYAPPIGKVFTILQAPPATVSGTFANDPVSFIPGKVYLWEVGYQSGRVADIVTLTVEDIVPCVADLNGDGKVDGADLGLLLADWGPCAGCLADIAPNGAVDGADLGLLLAAWGPCPF